MEWSSSANTSEPSTSDIVSSLRVTLPIKTCVPFAMTTLYFSSETAAWLLALILNRNNPPLDSASGWKVAYSAPKNAYFLEKEFFSNVGEETYKETYKVGDPPN